MSEGHKNQWQGTPNSQSLNNERKKTKRRGEERKGGRNEDRKRESVGFISHISKINIQESLQIINT